MSEQSDRYTVTAVVRFWENATRYPLGTAPSRRMKFEAHGFIERKRGGKVVRTWGTEDYGEVSHEGTVAAVVYHKGAGGIWRPHEIVTTCRGPRGGLVARQYDADYSKTAGSLYIHESGSGGNGGEFFVSRYSEPSRLPARIWLRSDVRPVTQNKGRKRRAVSDAGLRSLGYVRIDLPTPPTPFVGAMDGDTIWCETCQDRIPEDDDTYTCALCGEQAHEHGVGQVLVVGDEDEAGVEAGLYQVKRAPYYTSSLIGGGYIHENAVQRLGDAPDGVHLDGYPCGHICDACRDGRLAKDKAA